MFSVDDRAVAAYVRHSSGDVLLGLSPANTDSAYRDFLSDDIAVLTMSSAGTIQFSPRRYENFDQSFDMFQDGRIVVVPLAERDGKAVGAFINLVSGRRYFLAPTVQSQESLVKVRTLAGRWPDLTVIVPEDERAGNGIAHFPEFER